MAVKKQMRRLTRQDACRLTISRQHLDGAESPAMLDVFRDLGCVQLDPIRHVERTQRLVLWSRLGGYDSADLAALRWGSRSVFEYWAHAASMVLTEELPVHRYRMYHMRDLQQSRWAARMQAWFDEEPELKYALRDALLTNLRENGPQLSRDINGQHSQHSRWSNGRYVSIILEYLWYRGEVMVHGRSGNQRLWGLAETFWPETAPSEVWTADEVTRYAAQKAIRALGVATPQQIRRHFTRNHYPDLTKNLKHLVDEGVLEKVQVWHEGEPLKGEWYLHQDDVSLLDRIQAGDWQPRTTLLSPFDNLICDRDRTEQLWDFFYRIEIYVPPQKRQFGYYVLPILHGDQIIGRIDSTMDRQTSTWQIHNVYQEQNAPGGAAVATAVRGACESLAAFLEAHAITWGNVPVSWKNLAA